MRNLWTCSQCIPLATRAITVLNEIKMRVAPKHLAPPGCSPNFHLLPFLGCCRCNRALMCELRIAGWTSAKKGVARGAKTLLLSEENSRKNSVRDYRKRGYSASQRMWPTNLGKLERKNIKEINFVQRNFNYPAKQQSVEIIS